MIIDNVITHLKDYRPLNNTSTLQYTVFGLSPPPSPAPNGGASTPADAVAANVATPYNTPHDVNPIKRRGMGYTESGRSISPRRTVAKISARLEEAEQAQNAVIGRK